jgi:fatty-acyl-CoA synthase
VEGKVGSIGRVPAFLRHRFPAAIVRYDPETKAPLRGADGFCVRCGVDEPGEAIGAIASPDSAAPNRFEGYTSTDESDRKVLRDVFAPGDAWLRTGDLMRLDAQGFWYFVDRIGDTFRWKGENVSSAEVAEAIGACPGVREAVVWGAEIPGAEGRAGMAALVVDDGFDLAALQAHLAGRLPAYARPLILRLTPALAATGTFKLQSGPLAAQGYDPDVVDDPLYLGIDGEYRPLDAALHARLVAGELRL